MDTILQLRIELLIGYLKKAIVHIIIETQLGSISKFDLTPSFPLLIANK